MVIPNTKTDNPINDQDILKPINLARLWTREELERTKVQDAVRCCGITRQDKIIPSKRKPPRFCFAYKCCIRKS